jgi:hypothetical protein
MVLLSSLLLLALNPSDATIATIEPDTAEESVLAQTGAVLENPGFDNGIWYEFHDRYGTWLPQSWVPDGNVFNSAQNWRLWYMRDTPLIQSFPEGNVVHGGLESVALRSYDGNVQEGGLYQIIPNATPCLVYNFSMHALSRPDANLPNQSAQLRVGIDPTGWHTNPSVDPAFPGSYPASIVWSVPQDFKYPNFGRPEVTAEARSDRITVFTRALAYGGIKHAIVWDTGSLQDVTPARIANPAQPPAPGGVSNINVFPGTNSATITWNSTGSGMGQVYYRVASGTGPPPSEPMTYTTYLPLVIGGATIDWQATPLNKTATTQHSHGLSNLISGQYEYIIVTRGLSGDACITWASPVQTFVIP